ncbi:solute carrier family 22 member 13-like isoform X2 [Symsagittifera roscoffensis]
MSDLTLFDLTGGYGVYQFVYASLAALVTALVCTDSALTPFLFHDISHRCSVPAAAETSSNTSSYSPLLFNVTTTTALSSVAAIGNFSIVDTAFSDSCDAGYSLSDCASVGGQIEYECCYPFHSTVVSDFDLICENLHYKSIAESNLGLGYLVASVVIGRLSDRVGRRKVALYLLFSKIIINALLSLSANYYQFLILYFLNCFTGYGIFLSLFVLLTESFGSSHRYLVSVKVESASVLGELSACLLFYLASSWRQVPQVLTLTSFVSFFLVLMFLYESPLWLLSQGRMDKAEAVIKRMSIMNRRPIPPSKLIQLKQFYCTSEPSDQTKMKRKKKKNENTESLLAKEDLPQQGDKNKGDRKEYMGEDSDGGNSIDSRSDNEERATCDSVSIPGSSGSSASALDLFRHPTVRAKSLMTMFNWFSVTSAFYVIYLNMASLHGSDPYLSFIYGALIGIPSVLVFICTMQIFGRRPMFCLFMTSGALCGLGTLMTTTVYFEERFSPQAADRTAMWLTIGGKFFFGSAFGLVYIWSSELYPTPLRNTGMGLSSLCGRVGLLLVPFALEFGIVAQACVSMLGFVAAFQSLFLPETLGTALPQTLSDSQLIPLRNWGQICNRS